MTKHVLVLLLAALLTIPAVGCRPKAPADGGATGPSGDTSGSGAATDTGTGPAGEEPATMKVTVYFSVEDEGMRNGEKVSGERLVKSSRVVPKDEEPLTAAIAAWLSGPSEADKKAGMFLAAPSGLAANSISVAGGVATIDLPKAFEPKGGSAAVMNALGQLVYTATSVPGVKSVLLKLDGRTEAEFGGDGLDVSKPLTRLDVEDYFLD
jgi:spore germination protein GerM